MIEEGKAYTTGNSFRARAEAHQRRFRAQVLQLGYGEHAHWLKTEDAERGANFYPPPTNLGAAVLGRAHAEVLARADERKGVDKSRTLVNMLSSQAMCFNIFGNLRSDEGLGIAAKALRRFVPTIQEVKQVHLEYTPANAIFGDQSGRGGVDCDVLIEYSTVTGGGLLTIETKFVEEEFSVCGFRKRAGTARPGLSSCPDSTCPREDFSGCLYAKKKGYRYWDQSRRLQTLRPDVLQGDIPCPFGGGLWQLWVNHTLVHVEARERQLQEAAFAVCAPRGNDALLKGGETIRAFRNLLATPASMMLITLEDLVDALGASVGSGTFWQGWVAYLRQRYLV
jgi:hypothetical protein